VAFIAPKAATRNPEPQPVLHREQALPHLRIDLVAIVETSATREAMIAPASAATGYRF
jgi:hypothetical protein